MAGRAQQLVVMIRLSFTDAVLRFAVGAGLQFVLRLKSVLPPPVRVPTNVQLVQAVVAWLRGLFVPVAVANFMFAPEQLASYTLNQIVPVGSPVTATLLELPLYTTCSPEV